MSKILHKKPYGEARLPEYPSWRELAEAIYEERKGNKKAMDDYVAKVDDVKKRFPKK